MYQANYEQLERLSHQFLDDEAYPLHNEAHKLLWGFTSNLRSFKKQVKSMQRLLKRIEKEITMLE